MPHPRPYLRLTTKALIALAVYELNRGFELTLTAKHYAGLPVCPVNAEGLQHVLCKEIRESNNIERCHEPTCLRCYPHGGRCRCGNPDGKIRP